MATVFRSCRGRGRPFPTPPPRRQRRRQRADILAEPLEGRVHLAAYTVTTPADSGPGSLRQAILDANANPGQDVVQGSVSFAVVPLSPLPGITDPIVVQRLVIDGRSAGATAGGLAFQPGSAGSRAEDVTVRNFGGPGIVARAAATLLSCTVLDNGRGATASPGVKVDGAAVTIGRTSSLTRPTTVGGSGADGIAVTGGGTATLRYAWIGGGSPSVRGNAGHGVSVSGGGSLHIDAAAPGHVFVGGSGGDGVRVNTGSRPGTFRNAHIGTGLAGSILPNAGAGVRIIDSAGYRIENSSIGFNRGAGVSIEGPRARENVVTTLGSGGVWRNESHGVALLDGASGNTVGGGPGLLQVGNNGGSGVYIAGAGTEGNVVSRCNISDNRAGVTISNADRNVVGGADYAGRNSIARNRGAGIEVLSGRHNRLVVNLIHDNGGPGIDLGGDGVTANDPGDPDGGANDLQNHPVITSAVWEGDRVDVAGTIHTRPNTAARIDLYADPRGDVDLGGAGADGQYYLGSVEVTTGPDGTAGFGASLPVGGVFNASSSLPPGGYLVTATATARPAGAADAAAETSEFSPGARLEGPAHARVTGVLVNGTGWHPTFRRHLAARRPSMSSARFGFGLHDYEEVVERRALPWVNINEISIRFSTDVKVEQDDLRVTGERVPRYAVTSFRYDPYSLTASWRLTRAFTYDRITLALDSGEDGVRTVRGNVPLDGETPRGWPTGDGTPGGDFITAFDVWRGDVDRSRRVTTNDLYLVRSNQGATPRSLSEERPRYDAFQDVNGSGRIDALDLAYVRVSLATQPPPDDAGEPGVTGRVFRPDPRTFSFSP